jgi:hypothetical protein
MRLCLILLVFGSWLAMDPATRAAQPKPPPYTVSLRKSEDAAGIWAEGDVVVLSLQSPSGSGQAVLERQGESWPKLVAVYLPLKHLDHFRVSNGQDTLHAAVRLVEGQPRVRQGKGDKEPELMTRTNPLWMNICIMGADSKPVPTMPPAGGYFEITLPPAFFLKNPKSITLRWIESYR